MNKDYKNTVLNGYIVQATDNFNHAYDLGYGKGYEDGKEQQDKLWAGERYRQELTAKGYYRGLEDAWECAKKAWSMSETEFHKIFDTEWEFEDMLDNLSATEVVQKIKDYESTINYHDDFATALKKMYDYEERQKPHSLLDAYFQMRKESHE